MLCDEDEPSTSAKRGDVQEALSNSPAFVKSLQTDANDLPPYGAQFCQDALWEGANEALPPLWHQLTVLDGETGYQDDTLIMVSMNRPLPGVRLDHPGHLIPRCEWHISPLGRSYFVNHNTRTTSWKKPTPERPAGSVTPECVINAHSKSIWSLACLTSCNIMSTSDDGSICQWTKDGKQVGDAWHSEGGGVNAIAACPDETMITTGSTDGRLRLWNMRRGSVVGDSWEGHEDAVRCLDWCTNGLEIASGSEDGTIRRWNPHTGRQIAVPIQAGHGWVITVRYSLQGDKFASGGADNMVRVWSTDGYLLNKINGHDSWVSSLCWSKDGAHVFSASFDSTIRKWNLKSISGKQLVVLRGHTNTVSSFCLTPDERHLVSASDDYSVRIWDLETNQLIGQPLLHDDALDCLVMSSDAKYIASAGRDAKIYLWCLDAILKQHHVDQAISHSNAESAVKVKGRATRDARQSVRINKGGLARYGGDFWGDDTNSTPRLLAETSPLRRRNLFGFLRFSVRPTDTSQPLIPLQPSRRNFRIFPVRISKEPVSLDVAPCREEDRYGIAPESDAEAAAAMQRRNSNDVDSSTAQGQTAIGTQVSVGQPTQTQGSTGGVGETSYEVSCCGLVILVRPRRGR